MDETNKNFSSIISQFIQKIIALDRSEKFCYGVTLTQAYTINVISNKKIISMNELSHEMGLAISTLTRIIDVLVRDRIVCRNACVKDRRKVNICLTDNGNELAKKLQACNNKFWSKIFNSVPVEKKEQVIENLTILFDAIQKANNNFCSK